MKGSRLNYLRHVYFKVSESSALALFSYSYPTNFSYQGINIKKFLELVHQATLEPKEGELSISLFLSLPASRNANFALKSMNNMEFANQQIR